LDIKLIFQSYFMDRIIEGTFDRQKHLQLFASFYHLYPDKKAEFEYVEHLTMQASIVRDKIIQSNKVINIEEKTKHLFNACCLLIDKILVDTTAK